MLSWLPGDLNHKTEKEREAERESAHRAAAKPCLQATEKGGGRTGLSEAHDGTTQQPVRRMEMLYTLLAALSLAAPGQAQVKPTGPPASPESSITGNASVEPGVLGMAALRLANGSSPCGGTVQVLHHGRWTPVCRESWSIAASHALCKRLHCGDAEESGAADAPTVVLAPFGDGDIPSARNVCVAVTANCSSWERGPCLLKLATMPHCCRAGLAKVTCTGPHRLQLAGGRSRCEGRVEMEQAGEWGTVCDDAWDLTDANVVCRQLRCGWALHARDNASFGRGSGLILRDDVSCEGHEDHLWDCPATQKHDCSHKEDAGVVCSEHQQWQLSGGRDGCAGRVEVFFRGTWSTVCDSTWYETEASVLCHMLGCGPPVERPSFNHTLPGKMLYECTSPQPSLAHCKWTYNKSAPCHQSRAAGVICNGSQGLQTPAPVETPKPSSATYLSTGDSSSERAQIPLHMPLFILCLVLGALLLLTTLAFIITLLRMRKMNAHTVSSSSLAGPVLVTHSAQGLDVPSGVSNDYRDMPPSLRKGQDPPVTATQAAKESDSDSDSDSDYEHYDFSSKPPVALSTFYNSLRRQPGEQSVSLIPSQAGTFTAEETALLPPQPCNRASSSSSSSASAEPYCNDNVVPPYPWACPQPPADSTHLHAATPVHGSTEYPCAGWPPPSCPAGVYEQDSDTSEGSDYDDIQASAY
ncbi:T-cell differentiation antigen CD6 isoform X4 [Struthio camelus]|uniref:T-cell differentiation antigen CD6 isoform X4 n=1 Tax=Struthio camelus TaxID=8801 RepID=UPI003603E95A